jgi:hypothetical protein
MTTTDDRAPAAPGDLRLPPCPLPRPGDPVAWYEGRVLRHGTLLGSTYDGRPYIKGNDGLDNPLPGFDRIRIEDPEHPVAPMWRSLPPGGLICKPTDQERACLHKYADQTVPGGATPYRVSHEIWMRGFEVFLSGSQVRQNMAGDGGIGSELVTTMPPNRLRQMIVDMYGAAQTDGGDEAEIDAGELAAQAGRVRIGGQESSSDPYMTVRAFRSNPPGTLTSIYGASFKLDMDFGDFACNALYYDLENKVFIDPSGHGLHDAAACCLRPVLDKDRQPPEYLAYVGLAVLRQYLLHYTLCAGSENMLLSFIAEGLPSMDSFGLKAALQAEVIDRVRSDPIGRGYSAKEIMDGMESFFAKFHRKDLWDKYVFPQLGGLDLGGSRP